MATATSVPKGAAALTWNRVRDCSGCDFLGRPLGSWQTFDKTFVNFERRATPQLPIGNVDLVARKLLEFEALSKIAQWGADAERLIDETIDQVSVIDLRQLEAPNRG